MVLRIRTGAALGSAFPHLIRAASLGFDWRAVLIATSGFAALSGWQWAFLLLAPGPFIGALAMLTVRNLPEARRISGGRR